MSAGKGRGAVAAAINAAEPVEPGKAKNAPGPTGAPEYLTNGFEMRPGGLFKKADEGSEGKGLWLSAPFTIEAETRDSNASGWGLLISWKDRDGIHHEEVFSRSLFSGECTERGGSGNSDRAIGGFPA